MRPTPRIALLVLALLALAAAPAFGASPKPKIGRTVVVKPAGGTVLVKKRGGARTKLRKATAIPVRSTIDTSKGKVKLTSSRKGGGTQSGVFSQGAFVVTQRKSDGMTDLTLTGGDLSACAAGAAHRVGAAGNRRRRLFGNARGRFRTRGRNSSATVRGTEWLTEDTCDGTKVVNESDNETSMVETKTNDLEFDLEPGQTATGYCNRFEIAPDTYCVMLLAQPADGLIGAGIITQVDQPDYALCVEQPDGTAGCYKFPLSERDADGFRLSVLACPVGNPGRYYVGWSLDYENLLAPGPLSLVLDVAGPPVDCISEPPVPAA